MPTPAPLIEIPRNACSTGHAEQAGILVDACDYYVAFYRAALEARRYMLLSGWQFDSTVELLRGDDLALSAAANGTVRLLDFLNHLCETRRELEIFVLAWDFHVAFAMEREWLQEVLFNWTTNERLRFVFDSSHPPMASHHQKFVVVDGALSFLGGIDICEARWDDRRHLHHHPSRMTQGRRQKPYHDAQSYLVGRHVAQPLVRVFEDRWERACGERLALPEVPAATPSLYRPRGAIPFPPGRVAFSRTDPMVGVQYDDIDDGRPDYQRGSCAREVAELFADAIDSAERYIYLETQYFSSREIRDRIESRMRAPGRPMLDIILVLNQRAEAFKEQLAVGLRQAENIGRIRAVAAETGHHVGVFYVLAEPPPLGEEEPQKPTYIHTKLAIVDDRFLTIGSANLTNRSLGFDSEIHVSWDAADHEEPARLTRAIRRTRVSLLAEHATVSGVAGVARLARTEGLVAHLGDLTARPGARLQVHPSPTSEEAKALRVVDPQQLPFDPVAPDDSLTEELSEDATLFRAGLAELFGR